jgi:flagella basal body P-ring formation protein FlgA
MRFVAICSDPGGWRYEFVTRAKISARGAVAAADLPTGKTLSAEDVLLERHDISGMPDSFSDLAAVQDLATRRTIRAGDVLRQNMLVAPTLVKRGDPVRIVAKRDQIEVSMGGEALDTGARGATIRVKNASGVTIRARITDLGQVEPAD